MATPMLEMGVTKISVFIGLFVSYLILECLFMFVYDLL